MVALSTNWLDLRNIMITLHHNQDGITWSIEHLTIPDSIAYRKYRHIRRLLNQFDPQLPTVITLNDQPHDANLPIPDTFVGEIHINYQGVPYVTQIKYRGA